MKALDHIRSLRPTLDTHAPRQSQPLGGTTSSQTVATGVVPAEGASGIPASLHVMNRTPAILTTGLPTVSRRSPGVLIPDQK